MNKKQLRVTLNGEDAKQFVARKLEAENALGVKLSDAQYASMIIKKAMDRNEK